MSTDEVLHWTTSKQTHAHILRRKRWVVPPNTVTTNPKATYGSRRRGLAEVARRCDVPRLAWRRRSRCATASLLIWMTPTTVTGHEVRVFQPRLREPLKSEECPASCRDVFSKLEWGPSPRGGEGHVQILEVQERGEPKSGTGFMFEAATGAIAHACIFLQRAYGEESCWIEWDFKNRTMTFEPNVTTTGPCPCEDVDMVSIRLTNHDKHSLPVGDECQYAREAGIANPKVRACKPLNGGAAPNNYRNLDRCAREADCRIVDDRLQMGVMRDPRSVAVSAYFHSRRVFPHWLEDITVDEYVMNGHLAVTCEWMAVRYYLFGEVLGDKASLFWFGDAEDRPEDWHHQFFDFVGLRLPGSVVERASDVFVGRVQDPRILAFPIKGIDEHTGGAEAVVKRSYRDEVRSETLVLMDEELRKWLPPVLLEKFGVV